MKEIRELKLQKQLLEQELAELRKQPPRVTPRKLNDTARSPSPPPPAKITHQQPVYQPAPSSTYINRDLIYLPDHCPLTLRAVNANRNHLEPFRQQALKLLEQELFDIGIEKVAYYLFFLKDLSLNKI